MKKRLTQSQEFDIMKLVLDKFLWLGFGIMVFGVYTLSLGNISDGILWLISGAVVLVIFMILIVKEFEIVK